MRISKILSMYGICSRREAERMIAKGELKLNGKTVLEPYTRASIDDTLSVNGVKLDLLNKKTVFPGLDVEKSETQETFAKPESRIWLYNKPRGALVTNHDPFGRATIFDLLPKNMPRVISVGRLDYNSEGLLILTNDGALARRLELPESKIEREYICRHDSKLTETQIIAAKQGIKIEGFRYGSMKISYSFQKKDEPRRNLWCKVTISEGKNREIRKIFAYFSANVSRLIRVSYGPFKLNDIKSNSVVEVSKGELSKCMQEMGINEI